MFQPVFLGADRTSSFAPRNFLSVGEIVAFRAWVAELLEVSKIMHHEPFLLCSDRSTTLLFHQKQNPLAILVLA